MPTGAETRAAEGEPKGIDVEERAAVIVEVYDEMGILPRASKGRAVGPFEEALDKLLKHAPVEDPIIPVQLTKRYGFKELVTHLTCFKGGTVHRLGRLTIDDVWNNHPLEAFNVGAEGGLVAGSELEGDEHLVAHGMLPYAGEESGEPGLMLTSMSQDEKQAAAAFMLGYKESHPEIKIDPLPPVDLLLAYAVRRRLGRRAFGSATFTATVFPEFESLSPDKCILEIGIHGSDGYGQGQSVMINATTPSYKSRTTGRRYTVSPRL